MDKKVLLFFSLFSLLVIGGSLVLSLWVLPGYVSSRYPSDEPGSSAGTIEAPSTGSVAGTGHGPRNDIKSKLIIPQWLIAIGAIWIILVVGIHLKKKYGSDKPIDMQGYLFKISRLTGKSEYDIFCKAAEDWPVSGEQIENDFKRYLSVQSIPYYVNDFVRKNKKQIDELKLSPFSGSWFRDDT